MWQPCWQSDYSIGVCVGGLVECGSTGIMGLQ